VRATLEVDGVAHEVAVDRKAGTVTVDGQTMKVRLQRNAAGVVADVDGRPVHVALGDGTAAIEGTEVTWRVTELSVAGAAAGAGGGHGARVRPPMNGKVERVLVEPGQAVAQGDVLFVLEAMKMHNEVRSPVAGTVAAVHFAAGSAVEPSQVVVEVSPA
jgi:biotin carboxyl carrier protein